MASSGMERNYSGVPSGVQTTYLPLNHLRRFPCGFVCTRDITRDDTQICPKVQNEN